jgi:hypothetical protein
LVLEAWQQFFYIFSIFFNALAYPHEVAVGNLPDSIANDFYPQNVDNSAEGSYFQFAGSMGAYVYDSLKKGKKKVKKIRILMCSFCLILLKKLISKPSYQLFDVSFLREYISITFYFML